MKKVILVTGSKSNPLNRLVDGIIEKFEDAISSKNIGLEIDRINPSIFGSGTSAVVRAKLTIEYENLTEPQLLELDSILEIETADNVEIEIEVKEYE